MTTQTTDGIRPVGERSVVFVAFMVQALVCIGLFSLPVAAPFAAPQLGVPASLVGVQVGVLYAAAIVSSLLAAQVTRRFGGIRTSQISLAGTAFGLWLCASAQLWLMLIGTIVMGIAFGLPNPAAAELLQRYTDGRRRNLLYSIKQAGVPFGGVLASLAVGFGASYSWQLALASLGLAAGLGALAINPLSRPLDHHRIPGLALLTNPFGSVTSILALPVQRWFFVVSLLLAACQLSVATFGMQMLILDFAMPATLAAGIVALTQLAGFVGRLAGGALGDRLGALTTIGWLCLVLTVAAGVVAVAPASTLPLLVAILMFLVGGTSSGWSGLLLSEADHRAPAGMAADAAGVLMLASFVGVVTSSGAFGVAVPSVETVRIVPGFVAFAAFASLLVLQHIAGMDRRALESRAS